MNPGDLVTNPHETTVDPEIMIDDRREFRAWKSLGPDVSGGEVGIVVSQIAKSVWTNDTRSSHVIYVVTAWSVGWDAASNWRSV